MCNGVAGMAGCCAAFRLTAGLLASVLKYSNEWRVRAFCCICCILARLFWYMDIGPSLRPHLCLIHSVACFAYNIILAEWMRLFLTAIAFAQHDARVISSSFDQLLDLSCQSLITGAVFIELFGWHAAGLTTSLSGRMLSPTAAEFVPSASVARTLSYPTPPQQANGHASTTLPPGAADADATRSSAFQQDGDLGRASMEQLDVALELSGVVAASADETISALDQLCADGWKSLN